MRRSRTTLFTALTMTAGVLAAALSLPGPAESAAPTLPVLATGTITFPAGATTGQVMAFALPDQAAMNSHGVGDKLADPLIATADVASDGSFMLRADPATVPAANKNPNGTINIQAVAVSGGQEQLFFFPATPAVTATGRTFLSATTSKKPATPDISFNMRGGAATNRMNDTAKWTGTSGRALPASRMLATTRSTTTDATPKMEKLAAAVATGTVDASVPTCTVVLGDKYRANPEHFVNVYVDNNDTASAHVYEGASADHNLGIALKLSDGSWGAGGTGQISRSADTKAYSANRQIAWGYWNKVNYQQASTPCNGRTWRGPYGFYDILSADLDGSVPMLWLTNSCGEKNKGDTWDTGSATAATFGFGVDIGPVSLSAQTGYGSSENIHYLFLKHGEIAGNSIDGPVGSSKIEVDQFACPF